MPPEPGVGADRRGIAARLIRNIAKMLVSKVRTICSSLISEMSALLC